MSDRPENIVLTGMPGVGKSTVGVILAKRTGRDFVDTDVLIQVSTRRSLQDIVDRDGYEALRAVEEDVLAALNVRHSVIATGGSAVYSERAMRHLKENGVVVYLAASLPTLTEHVRDFATRGLVKRPGQSIAELLEERRALYDAYADVVVDCDGKGHEQVCAGIIAAIAGWKRQHS